MLTIDPKRSLLLVVDFQSRLVPAIHDGETAVRNANRLIEAAKLFGIPRLFTEQNAKGLGPTVADIAVEKDGLVHKEFFDACREDGFLDRVPTDAHVVVAGCESHVCVQQTVLGLLQVSRKTYVARDALGSRHPEDKETAVRRMERHGAEIVTTEMVVFEWLQTADNPHFRRAVALIK
ncbi:isochorismatase family protein [Bradyrhizobium cenepequi]|uniref:isochorismatase family protein n=1 Tax=Bradyrhizobium cenepequi TaxID=2821403 RepID=UPI001CE2E08D|nr:isochorismatase family protein [Bradyrhizobium cenepequi]MCA6111147.1 isochorismatase family protein [Bradyrhizobium cenepequi]